MQRKKQKTVPAEQDWAVLEEKFNDLLTPILGYAEFLQMQLGPESELYQDARELSLLPVSFRRCFRRSLPITGRAVPCLQKTMGERIKAMGWGDENAMERKSLFLLRR